MYASKSISNQQTNEVNGRQIALFAAFILPAGKLLETPSLLSKYAKGDLLLPAFLQFLFQALILFLLLLVVRKSEMSLLQRLQALFGKWTAVFYSLYAVYFIFSAILPLLQLEKYVYAAFFDTARQKHLAESFYCVRNTRFEHIISIDEQGRIFRIDLAVGFESRILVIEHLHP